MPNMAFCPKIIWSGFYALYIPVNNFSVMSGQLPVFLGWTSIKQLIKSLAQGQNTVTQPAVSLKLATLRSLVWHSTNWAQLWSHCVVFFRKTLYPLLSTISTQDTSWHDWKNVDWDVKFKHKQTYIGKLTILYPGFNKYLNIKGLLK